MEQTIPSSDMPAPAGPGDKLRQARLDLKLAPADVANILRLSPRQILALENDDYPSLPGPTYIRGYLRSYAQLLGLAPEKIIESYNSVAAATPAVDLTKLAPTEQVTTKDYRIKLVSLGVLAVVASLSIVWWQGREKAPAAPKPTSNAITYQTESGAVITDGSSADGPANASATTGTTTPPPVTDARAAVASAVPAPAPVTPATTAPTPVTSTTAVPAAPSGPRARLVLRVEQDCWADIRDGRQNRLIYETIPAGRVVSLEGVAPLSVFLGNADGVRVEFNGQPFDTSPHKRGPVARFMLGDNVSVTP
jgi:cytoskeleton protein RodZ